MSTMVQDNTVAPKTDRAGTPKERITVFRKGDAEPITPDCMPFIGVDESVMAGFGRLAAAGATMGEAEQAVILFKQPGENGLSLCYAWFKSGYALPRHSHNADCVYFIMGGELQLGSQTLGKGDGFFVPADNGYTYTAGAQGVEVLEFRNANQFHIHFKDNDERHWSKLVETQTERSALWSSETLPPSDR